jgi:hypothetical protein
MTTDRANWDDATLRTFLELVIVQKNQFHWNQKGLTTIGWANVYPAFTEAMGLPYVLTSFLARVKMIRKG